MRKHSKTRATLAFLAAAVSILLLVVSALPPPGDPAQPLAAVSSHATLFALVASLALVWSVLCVPLPFVLGAMLSDSDPVLVGSATLLMAVGVLVLGLGVFTGTAATLALASSPATDPDPLAQQVRFWSQMRFYLTDPGLMTWGAGQFLFCWLHWGAGQLPRPVVLIGLLGGAAGLLTLAVYETRLLALIQLLSLAVLGTGLGWRLLRRSPNGDRNAA